MLPTRGRPKVANSSGSNCHCCFENCKSDSRKSDTKQKKITFVRFSQPCITYRNEQCSLVAGREICKSEVHDVTKCEQCTKCLRWLQLAQRKDGRLSRLMDVNRSTYVCSLHFANPTGPTPDNPDPLPANFVSVTAASKLPSKLPIKRIFPPCPVTTASKCAKTGAEMPMESIKTEFQQPKVVQGGETIEKSEANVGILILNEKLSTPTYFVPNVGLTTHVDEKLPKKNNNSENKSTQTTSLFELMSTEDFSQWSILQNNGSISLIRMRAESWGWKATTAVNISQNFSNTVKALGKELPNDHPVLHVSKNVSDMCGVERLLKLLNSFNECSGISDKKQKEVFDGILNPQKAELCEYDNNIRSKNCKLLTKGIRCTECLKYSGTLRSIRIRNLKKPEKSSKFCNNRFLSPLGMQEKISNLTKEVRSTTDKLQKMKKKINKLKETPHGILAKDDKHLEKLLLSSESDNPSIIKILFLK